jgi:6-phospho-3-hexuloisomerase
MTSGIKDSVAAIVREIDECLGKVRPESVAQALQEIVGANKVFLAGKGRSALGVRGFAMRLMHLGMDAHLVGETTTPPISAGDCLIIGSGSGATPSLVAIAEQAKALGATIVLFTIDPNSPIGALADRTVVIPASSPKARSSPSGQSVQPMGSLFEQCLFLLFDALVIALMQEKNMTASEMFTRHANLE